MGVWGGREKGDRECDVPLSDPYGVHGLIHNRRTHEFDPLGLSRHAVLGLLDIRAQVEDLGDAQALEDCLALGADVGDLSGAKEKSGA